MDISVRTALPADLDVLLSLYRSLEAEQTGLGAMWPLVDGLAEPVEASVKEAIGDPERRLLVGSIDEVPLGFLLAGTTGLLPQAGGERIGQIQLIFTEFEARGVGVGEAMITAALEYFRGLGLSRFDAKVSPGHRLAKNFFEAAGFSARSIVMHHRGTGDRG